MERGIAETLIRTSPEVAEALSGGLSVVALETTLVTHGFDRPTGLEIALELEETVRQNGAVPATIGVLDGRLIVGMTATELQRLADSDRVAKLNPGNLAAGIVSGEPGSTTVAATLLAAFRVGISIMATGGIGGVHRRVSETGDVSADLVTLSRTPVAVVCAGAKAILDLPRTLEALETLGVPVYGYGAETLPAFYRRDSGLPVDRCFSEPQELAAAIELHLGLGGGSGVVVANPIPPEHEMPEDLYRTALDRSLAELETEGIQGRQVTPFLLARLRELTEGRSTFSNVALLRHNARLAGRLAAYFTGR